MEIVEFGINKGARDRTPLLFYLWLYTKKYVKSTIIRCSWSDWSEMRSLLKGFASYIFNVIQVTLPVR